VEKAEPSPKGIALLGTGKPIRPGVSPPGGKWGQMKAPAPDTVFAGLCKTFGATTRFFFEAAVWFFAGSIKKQVLGGPSFPPEKPRSPGTGPDPL